MFVLVHQPICNITKTMLSLTTRSHELTLVMYSLFHHPSCKPPPDTAVSTTKPPAVSPVPTQRRSTLSFSCKGSNTTNYSNFPTVTIKLPFQAVSDCAADGLTWQNREMSELSEHFTHFLPSTCSVAILPSLHWARRADCLSLISPYSIHIKFI